MTLDELNSTLSAAIASGKVGTPVSLRLHLQAANSSCDAIALLDCLTPLLRTTFESPAGRLFARRNAVADQLTVQFEFAGGQTALISCGYGSAKQTSIELLLVGNRGVIRLQGGELFEIAAMPPTLNGESMRPLIEQSIAANQPVAIGRP